MTRVNSEKWGTSTPLAFCFMLGVPIYEMLPLRMMHWTDWPSTLLKRLVRSVRLFLRFLQCQTRGHHTMSRKAWVVGKTGWGVESEGAVGEYHVGCTTCTRYWFEDANQVRKSAVKYWGLGMKESEE